jgi:iron complex outermembrane receptor protein
MGTAIAAPQGLSAAKCCRVALSLLLTSPGAAMATTDAEGQPVLEEVVVTAQRREQRLQEVPISMTVLSASVMEQQQMANLADIAKSTPNMVLRGAGSGVGKSVQAFIRDVGQSDFSYTVEPGVGIYLDDQYLATLFSTMLDLLDLERVEVLRGPQGTLFGRNSIGGAIRLITNKPRGDGTGYLEATVGTFDRLDVRGVIDVPVASDRVFLRIAAVSKQRDGYVEQLDFACVHPDLGGIINAQAPLLPLLTGQHASSSCKLGDLGGENVQAARATLRWLARDDIEFSFAADWMNDHSEAAAQTLVAVNTNASDPANLLPVFNANVAIPLYGIPYGGRFIPPGFYQSYATFTPLPHVGPSPAGGAAVTGITSIPNANGVRAWGAAATVTWTVTPSMQLKSISTYRGYSGLFSDDVDASTLNETFQEIELDYRQYSQEFQLHGTSLAGRLDWTVGLFYFDGSGHTRGPVDLSALSWIVPNLDFNMDDVANAREKAAYLQATFRLSHKWDLTVGARYTREDKDYLFHHTSFVPSVPDLIPETEAAVDYSRTNPRLVLSYHWTPDLTLYASVASGFRGGGFNGRPFNPSEITSFAPETLTAYEVGAKSEWLDRRLRVNLSAFISEYKDIQVGVLTIDQTGTPFSKPLNLGRARIVGGELEIDSEPVSGLVLSAGVGVSHYVVTALGSAINCGEVTNPIPAPAPGANCTIGGPKLGPQLPFLPEVTANAAVSYTFRFPSGSSVTPQLNLSYQSKSFTDVFGTESAALGGYTLMDGSITWQAPHAVWSVALSATNLTDKQYYIDKRNLLDLWGQILGQPGPPREWAVTVRRIFH